MRKAIVVAAACLALAAGAARGEGPAGYCNPLNLSYRFQLKEVAKAAAAREAADPSVAFYKGEYWLLASKSGGYWHSADLRTWSFVRTKVLPTEEYAPDARVIDEMFYDVAGGGRIFRTSDPAGDKWEFVGKPHGCSDPDLFQDDDGRAYYYWGCSDKTPVWGQELSPKTMVPLAREIPLFNGEPKEHGWERPGDKNDENVKRPWTEGAWMTKANGLYYLQFASPGTQFSSYGDGVYVGRSPLGPFAYGANNPMCFKPGGFINGAGHGTTFADNYGNWWHLATMRISVKHSFERRLGLFPVGFDADGEMYCNTSFGDYPARVPDGTWDPWKDASRRWMLLSYHKPVKASSSLPKHEPEKAVDEDVREYFSAATGDAGEWLRVDLGAVDTVNAVQVNFAEEGCDQYDRPGEGEDPMYHQYRLEGSADGEKWFDLADKRENGEDVPHDYIELAAPVEARYVRLTNKHMPAHGKFAVSGLRVFGRGHGPAPVAVSGPVANRDASDPRHAVLKWDPVPGATGYNVWWGHASGKLYHTWMVYGEAGLEMNCLNKGDDFWVRVDAFGENGVTEGKVVHP